MNLLSLTTNPTEDPHVFDTCWMTGLVQKGRIRVTVPRLDDAEQRPNWLQRSTC